jgi:dynein heavy chain
VVYDNICRGLFNRHKRIFSFLMAARIDLKNKRVSSASFGAFLKGVLPVEITKTTFASTKIARAKYQLCLGLAREIPSLKGLPESLESETKDWEEWVESPELHLKPLPKKMAGASEFDRILITKVLR